MRHFTKLIFLAAMLLTGTSASAQLADGKYVFKNVASGLYWYAANNWGTRASLMPNSQFQTLHQQTDGTYTMETQVSNGDANYFFGGDWMDGAPVNLTITPKGKYYTIAAGDNYFGNSTEAGSFYGSYILGKNVDKDSDDALWEIYPADASSLAGATFANPIDATYLIPDADFGRNNRYGLNGGIGLVWTMNTQWSQNLSGGTNENKCAESWRCIFNMGQEIAVPNGVYKLEAQAATNNYDGIAGNYPVVFANGVTSDFIDMNGGENIMDHLSNAFAAGKYEVEPLWVVVTNGKMSIGTRCNRNNMWCIWDNFRLTYYGTSDEAKEYAYTKNTGAEMTISNFVTTGWTCTNNNTFHINTWSGEGNPGNDPTGMTTPFIENWVGKPGPLGAGSISQTLNSLAPGSYKVTALIRVYSESGASPAGGTFSVNGRELDLASGKSFEYNGMKGVYDTYTLSGKVKKDGKLTVAVNISNKATFNWIAIKDIKVAYAGAAADALPMYLTFPDYSEPAAGYQNTWKATVDEKTWTLDGFNNQNNAWEYVACGRKNRAQTATITSPKIFSDVSDVVLYVGETSGVEEAYVTVFDQDGNWVENDTITDQFDGRSEVQAKIQKGNYASYYQIVIKSKAGSKNGTTIINKVGLYEQGQYLNGYELNKEALELAADADAVAVGKLIDAIEAGDLAGLDAAIKQFKLDNADLEDGTTAKAAYAALKQEMAAEIEAASALSLTKSKGRADLQKAIAAAEATLDSNKLNIAELQAEIETLKAAEETFKAIPEDSIEDGKYYFKNMASGLFWGAANDWGTRASLVKHPEYMTLAIQPDGTYTLETQVSNGDTNYFFGGDYMDGQPVNLTISPVGEGGEETVDFDGSFYHNWSEVNGTATDNGSANGGVKIGEEVGAGGAIWGNLTGAVPYLCYANITDYNEIQFEGTPGAQVRLMCNRVVDEGPIYEVIRAIGEDGKLSIPVADLKFLNGGAPCDFVCLQGIKVPWGGSAVTLTSIKLVKESGNQLYTIANGENYFGYDGENSVLGKNLAADSENALWQIIPEAKMVEMLSEATSEEPVDATFLFLDPNFGRNNRNKAAWTGDDFSVGGDNTNMNAEKWGGNSQTFDISQTVDAPNGLYKITWNGYYRYNNTTDNTTDVAIAAHADGTEVINSFVYINDKDYALTSIADDAASAALEGKLPFSQGEASAAFGKGLYAQSATVTVTDGKLTIGIKKTDHPGCDWTVWDNFELTYYGLTDDPEVPTGINEITRQQNNGEGSIFNLQGQKVKSLKKGLYIINGKKVFIK